MYADNVRRNFMSSIAGVYCAKSQAYFTAMWVTTTEVTATNGFRNV